MSSFASFIDQVCTDQLTMSSFESIIDQAYADFQTRNADGDTIAMLKHQNTSMRLRIMYQDEMISKLLASNDRKRKIIHERKIAASAAGAPIMPPRTRTRTRTDFSTTTPPMTSAAVWRFTNSMR